VSMTIGSDKPVAAATIQVLVINPDSTYEVCEIDQRLSTLQRLVGGYIEPIQVEGATFWCNEEGKIHSLARNSMATYLWWKLDPAIEGLDELRGTVVVTGPADEGGDNSAVFESVVDLYRRMESVRMDRSLDAENE
jgi:hypothetical protein